MRYIKILFVLSFLFFADEENLKNKKIENVILEAS